MKIYLIPGLGFDQRIFEKINLEGYKYSYINWIEPDKNEDIKSYAGRLSANIHDNAEKVILIGHSMGGVMCREIAAIKKVDLIILISSIKSRSEIPFRFKLVSPLLLYKFFTKEIAVSTVQFWGKYYDYVSTEERELFKSMLNRQSNNYLQWALRRLSEWQNPVVPANTKIFQIHGEKDNVLPVRLIHNPDVLIQNAGHFMVFRQPEIIREAIMKGLDALRN